MTCERSFITFRRNVLFLPGQNLVQADAELAGNENMCPSAHILHCRPLQGFLNHSHWLLLTLSFCLLPQLWPVRGSPNYPTQASHSFLLHLHSIYLNHIYTLRRLSQYVLPQHLKIYHKAYKRNKVTKCAKYFKSTFVTKSK